MPVSEEQKNEGLVSITQVLDSYTEPSIWEWKVNVGKAKAKAISQEALAIGKEVDRLVQLDIKGTPESVVDKPEPVKNAYMGWLSFKEKYPLFVKDITDIQVELIGGGVVGHPDIVHVNEIADIKTSKQLIIRPKWVVQVSKYALMRGKDRASIILLSKAAPQFIYFWWDGELLEYFGKEVFEAFRTIMSYEGKVKQMVNNFLEMEALS
jgi:hypothetical protein